MAGGVNVALFASTRKTAACGVEYLGNGRYRAVRVALENGSAKQVLAETVFGLDSGPAAARALGCRPGEHIVFALPGASVLLQWLTLPSVEERQIARMMPHEVRAVSPWPEDDLRWGYRIAQRDAGEGHSRVMLVLARASRVNEHLAALHAAGLRPTRVEPSTFSLARLVEREDPCAALLHVGGADMELVRCAAGALRFARAAEREGMPEVFLRETRALEPDVDGSYYEEAFVALEDEAVWTRLHEAMPLTRRVEDVRLAGLNGLPRLEGPQALCIAAALAPVAPGAMDDLLPPAEQRRIALGRLVRQAAVTVPAVLWCVGVLYGLFAYFLDQERAYIERTRVEIRELRSAAGDLEGQSQRLAALRGEFQEVSGPLEIVLELYRRTPQSIALNFMSYDARRTLVIGGESPSYPALLEYVTALQDSPWFREVGMNYGAQPRSSAGAFVDFKITCRGVPKDVHR
jgi:hypothetical protein